MWIFSICCQGQKLTAHLLLTVPSPFKTFLLKVMNVGPKMFCDYLMIKFRSRAAFCYRDYTTSSGFYSVKSVLRQFQLYVFIWSFVNILNCSQGQTLRDHFSSSVPAPSKTLILKVTNDGPKTFCDYRMIRFRSRLLFAIEITQHQVVFIVSSLYYDNFDCKFSYEVVAREGSCLS